MFVREIELIILVTAIFW